jgi:hypothetical protein
MNLMITFLCGAAVGACIIAAVLCLTQMIRLSKPPVCSICGNGINIDEQGEARCDFCGETYTE